MVVTLQIVTLFVTCRAPRHHHPSGGGQQGRPALHPLQGGRQQGPRPPPGQGRSLRSQGSGVRLYLFSESAINWPPRSGPIISIYGSIIPDPLEILRPNPKSLTGGLSRLWHRDRVDHGKCVGVDHGLDIRSQKPCFSLDSVFEKREV
jgi:hypothetical protein